MRIADFAVITLDPQHILESRWAHNTAHDLVEAKRRALSASSRAQRRPAP